jgi:hypothetical protein
VILSQPLLVGASISASSISIPKAVGVAYFTNKGELKSSSSVQLTEEGNLEITDLYKTINLHNNSLMNVSSLTCAHLDRVQIASIQSLYLPPPLPPHPSSLSGFGTRPGSEKSASATWNQVLSLHPDGLVSSSTALLIDNDSKELFVHKLSVQEVMGNVNFHAHQINNATLRNSDITQATKISTHSLQLLTTPSSSSNLKKSLTVIDTSGHITSDSSENILPIQGSYLELKNLNILSTQQPVTESMTLIGTTNTQKVVSGKDLSFTNGELRTPTLTTQRVQTKELFLETPSPRPSSLVSIDSSGKLISTTTAKLDDLQTKTLSVTGSTKLHGDIQLTGLSSTVLSVNQEGRIVSGHDSKFDSLISKKGTFATLILDSATGGGVLSSDSHGFISSSRNLSLDMLHSKTQSTHSLTVNEIFLKNLLSASMLTTDSSGKLQSSSDFVGHSMKISQGQVNDLLVTDKLTVSSLSSSASSISSQSKSPSTSFLSTDTSGQVIKATNGRFDSLELKELSVTKKLSVSSLQFHTEGEGKGRDSLNKGTGGGASVHFLLHSDHDGNVIRSTTGDISVNTLHVHQDSVINGDLSIQTLTIKSLLDTPPLPSPSRDSDRLLTVTSTGKIEAMSNLILSSLESKTSIVAPIGKFHHLELLNIPHHQPLSINGSGAITSSTQLTLESVKTQKIDAGTGSFDSLILNRPSSSSSGRGKGKGALTIDSNGLISFTNQLEVSTSVVDEKLIVNGETHLNSLFLSSSRQDRDAGGTPMTLILQVDPQTNQVSSTSSNLNLGTVTTSALQTANLNVNHLTLKIDDSVKKPEAALLIRSVEGHVTPLTEKNEKDLVVNHLKISTAEIKRLTLNVEDLIPSRVGEGIKGFLTISPTTGQVILSNESSINHLESDRIHVKTLHLQERLHLNPDMLRTPASDSSSSWSGARSTILSLNKETNELSLHPHVDIDSLKSQGIITESLRVTGQLQLTQIPSSDSSTFSSSLVGVNEDGFVVPSDELHGQVLTLAAQVVTTEDLVITKSLKLANLHASHRHPTSAADSAASHLLGLDADGHVEVLTSVTLPSLSVNTVLARHQLQTPSISLLDHTPGVLVIDEQTSGLVKSSTRLKLQEVTVKKVDVTSSLHTPEIILTSSGSAPLQFVTDAPLTVDSNGKVVSTTTARLEALQTQALSVIESTRLHGPVHLTSLSNTVLSVNQDGQIVSSTEVSFDSLSSQSLTNTGTLRTGDIEIQNLKSVEGGVVTTSPSGHLSSTRQLSLQSLHTQSLTVSSASSFQELTATSLRLLPPADVGSTRHGEEMVFLDPTGKLISKPALEHLVVKEGKFNTLAITDKLSSKAFQFSSTSMQPLSTELLARHVLTTTPEGVIQHSSEIEVNSLHVHQKLVVLKEFETNSLKLKTLKPGTLLMSDRMGTVTSCSEEHISMSGGGDSGEPFVIRIRELSVENLREDVNMNKKKLSNAVITKSQIVNSEIRISPSASPIEEDSYMAVIDQVN